MAEMGRERGIRELLHEAFRRSGLVRGVQRAEAVVAWRGIVGDEVARFAAAAALQQGTLVVDVSDPETAMHLGLQRHHLIRAYAERLGPDVVRDIRFRVGRPATPVERHDPAPHVGADPRALAALARDLQGVPDELSGPALQAGAALLALQARRRAAGWRPCQVCGVLHEPGPSEPTRAWCHTCERQARLPRVQRAAERFAIAPDDDAIALSADERSVARALATAIAEERALALLPRVLADPALRTALEYTARVQAALATDIDLDAVDDEALRIVDARVLRALGRWDGPPRPPQQQKEPS